MLAGPETGLFHVAHVARVLLYFQGLTVSAGGSTQHACNMEQATMSDHPQARRVEKISALLDLLLGEAKLNADQSNLGECFLEASRVNRLLALREKAWRELREPRAVVDAILICKVLLQPTPDWVTDATLEISERQKSRNTNRRRQELTVHFVRWAAVTELRARRKELLLCGDDRGSSWERCYAAVSDAQANTPAAGGEATVKASYQHIQRLIRAGRGEQFLSWRAALWAAGLSILDQPGIILDRPH